MLGSFGGSCASEERARRWSGRALVPVLFSTSKSVVGQVSLRARGVGHFLPGRPADWHKWLMLAAIGIPNGSLGLAVAALSCSEQPASALRVVQPCLYHDRTAHA